MLLGSPQRGIKEAAESGTTTALTASDAGNSSSQLINLSSVNMSNPLLKPAVITLSNDTVRKMYCTWRGCFPNVTELVSWAAGAAAAAAETDAEALAVSCKDVMGSQLQIRPTSRLQH